MLYFLFVGDRAQAAPVVVRDETAAKVAAGAVAASSGEPVTVIGVNEGYLALIEPQTPAEHLAQHHQSSGPFTGDCGARPECAERCDMAARGHGPCAAYRLGVR